ncbi:hypothetical protein B0H16DRAFT_1522391 [Mycena metata]|uniref:Uncharacterized protein n=1 Tax=Mycena metata TaxID=1033252 RepID=A0AAD7JPG8_9AGAR|nr:hypothetical protein B0H16DRAFT_1522391 [Mycena metata]
MDAEPALPLDLEREIFETAALLYPGTRPTLLRVSRRVLVWIEPLLYRALRIDSPKTAAAIKRAMELKPSIFFSDNVRSLYISSFCGWPNQTRCAFLRLCPNLVSLSLGVTLPPTTAILPVLEGILHVRKWRGSLWHLFGEADPDPGHPFFRTITHMDLLRLTHASFSSTLLSLGQMPALTHLCLHDVTVDVVSGLLRECSRLQILLVVFPPHYPERKLHKISSAITDVRCVVVMRGRYPHGSDDWLNHNHDFWAGAETFVARKRRGEVGVSARWLEPEW